MMIWPFNRENNHSAREASEREAVIVSDPLRLLASVAQVLPDPFIVIDGDGFVIICNPPAEDIIDMPLLGQPIAHAVRSPVILDALAEVLAGADPLKVEFAHRVPLERRFEAFIAAIGRTHGPGEPAALIMLRDLTREQQLERMRADFVANASHELRTPLASLMGFIDTLDGPARNDEPARQNFLRLMRTQAERMARLIDDLLSLSRIELNAHRRPTSLVDLVAIIRQAADMLLPAAQEAEVDISLDLSGGLTVRGDHDELLQVAGNLIENAVKYASRGKRIQVKAARELNGDVEFSVEDFGPGIPPEHLPRLTERFYRVSIQESRSRGGTGLGLAIVKHILNRHRAKLIITSKLGQGSRFTVRFPAEVEKK
jgi:two-component system, OmpR family, phosphate regulon sensor histidine kinase PhoR